jgi:protein-tyrosine phosphatase
MNMMFPIPVPSGKLAIVTRPRAGLTSEIAASWREAKLTHIVSLLEEHELAELGLSSEAESCHSAGIRFRRFPLPDGGVPPSEQDLAELLRWIVDELQAGASIGIHCRMGIGRSAVVAVCVLISMGVGLDEAWERVEHARGTPVPHTDRQRTWVADWVERTSV